MAPKRANQQGAISQMYTSLASPDNRSVVTAVAFFAVSAVCITPPSREASWSLQEEEYRLQKKQKRPSYAFEGGVQCLR
ncbi:unnamed protein product [Aureobasidium mustum]|uniref:Uncharacterized protein n=1 Tax=Aureobasidium mustum TaxID=2773714 RepID=A0A9N8KD64_9PEZI|nr:unnamed protein product [Aureobasidium mustum]